MARTLPRWALLGAAACGLAACQVPPVLNQNAARLTALPPARACDANLPTFGRFPIGGGTGAEAYLPPDGRIAMRNDGGWCMIRFTFAVRGQIPVIAPLRVARTPAHGQAQVGSVGRTMLIAYRPAPGFAGTDDFIVHMAGPEPWRIPVHAIIAR